MALFGAALTRKISKEARESSKKTMRLLKLHHVHGKKFDYVAAEKTFTKQQGEPVEIYVKPTKLLFL